MAHRHVTAACHASSQPIPGKLGHDHSGESSVALAVCGTHIRADEAVKAPREHVLGYFNTGDRMESSAPDVLGADLEPFGRPDA